MSQTHLYEEVLRRIAGMFPPPKPSPIRPSATVVPWRRGSGGRTEVFWVKRSPALGVLGGWHAFPGGGVGKHDAATPIGSMPVVSPALNTSFPVFDVRPASPDVSPDIVACAVRELFEETGLLLSTAAPTTLEEQREARRRLLARQTDFASILASFSASIDARRLTFAGRWLTPPVAPFRFDTRFFLLHWPEEEPVQPQVDGGELCEGEWVAAENALDRWRGHAIFAAPPTLYVLEVLAKEGPDRGLQRLVQHGDDVSRPMQRFIENRPGVVSLPLVTPTLPPARETVSYLLGRDEVVLVDVGSPFPGEIDRLAAVLDFMRDHLGKRLTAIWLTHHHPDHVWGVELLRRRVDVPVLAHPETAERVEPLGVRVDAFLRDGQRVQLAGDPPLTVQVIETPGHARGHLCFLEEEHGALIAGDLVAGLGTVLIDPPDGDMDEYLASLERVRSLRPRTLFPAHGPAVLDPESRLLELIEHRLEREARILACWERGARTPAEIVPAAYSDVSPELHPFAERQVLAHLGRLRNLGKIDAAAP